MTELSGAYFILLGVGSVDSGERVPPSVGISQNKKIVLKKLREYIFTIDITAIIIFDNSAELFSMRIGPRPAGKMRRASSQ
ncbi:UNVERIFIED_CONTAM: hypothetical protein NCL1_12649 [Trichonephila clavipes]